MSENKNKKWQKNTTKYISKYYLCKIILILNLSFFPFVAVASCLQGEEEKISVDINKLTNIINKSVSHDRVIGEMQGTIASYLLFALTKNMDDLIRSPAEAKALKLAKQLNVIEKKCVDGMEEFANISGTPAHLNDPPKTNYDDNNIDLGLQYLNAALANGYVEANVYFAYIYITGLNQPKNINRAIEYAEKAAKVSNLEAINLLGILADMDFAKSSSKDRKKAILAYGWYNIAASRQVNNAVLNRDYIGKQINSDELKTAQDYSIQCIETNFTICRLFQSQ